MNLALFDLKNYKLIEWKSELILETDGSVFEAEPYEPQWFDKSKEYLAVILPDGAKLKDIKDKIVNFNCFIEALKLIASYGNDGVCPYGCDAPNIAKSALDICE